MFARTPVRPAFDVVSIKPTPPERINHLKYEKCNGGGPFLAEGAPLLWTIEFAYRFADVNLTPGHPAWIESFADAYDIEGKPAGAVTAEQCRQMAQSLLEDRFALKTHCETKERKAVTDRTGLAGMYSLSLEFSRKDGGRPAHRLHRPARSAWAQIGTWQSGCGDGRDPTTLSGHPGIRRRDRKSLPGKL